MSNFASEIHIIHRRDEFRAEPALVEQVMKADSVTVHTPEVVEEFVGEGKLKAVRIGKAGGGESSELSVDGVFLEIGLEPNSGPVAELLRLNEAGEVPTKRDQSTAAPGLFSAGDVTDCREKQISISVGQGAMAALTAYKYLVEKGLTSSGVSSEEIWE